MLASSGSTARIFESGHWVLGSVQDVVTANTTPNLKRARLDMIDARSRFTGLPVATSTNARAIHELATPFLHDTKRNSHACR